MYESIQQFEKRIRQKIQISFEIGEYVAHVTIISVLYLYKSNKIPKL